LLDSALRFDIVHKEDKSKFKGSRVNSGVEMIAPKVGNSDASGIKRLAALCKRLYIPFMYQTRPNLA
jgi:hypothetical protein